MSEQLQPMLPLAASFPRQTDMLHAKSAEGFDTPSLPYKEGHWFQTPRGGAIILIEKGVRLVFWGEKGRQKGKEELAENERKGK